MSIKIMFAVASILSMQLSWGADTGMLNQRSLSTQHLPNPPKGIHALSHSDPADLQNQNRCKKVHFGNLSQEINEQIATFVLQYKDLQTTTPEIFESSFVQLNKDSFFFNLDLDAIKNEIGITRIEDHKAVRILRNIYRRHICNDFR